MDGLVAPPFSTWNLEPTSPLSLQQSSSISVALRFVPIALSATQPACSCRCSALFMSLFRREHVVIPC